MKWLQQLIERVCKTTLVINQNGYIKMQHYSISIRNDDSLYSIRVVDLLNVRPPRVSKPLYYDEVEEHLIETIKSL